MNITNLVKKYELNRKDYLKSNYNETQLRTDFLDPLFQLLGWDISNSNGKLTNEREVLVEEGLKAHASANTKKPDYTFRLFSERKFFVEAKKPSVKIERDDEPAKQVRRYGFTAKLKISVLSNFEYLVIYDCSSEVKQSDTVKQSQINIYHYTEYESAFENIKAQLGRQSVYSGQFDKNWKHIEDQIKLSSVDDLFLAHINQWRVLLGNEIYSHKPDLSIEELNDTVQSYINSIIFLRVCEDRNLEDYKTLLKFAESNDFKALLKKLKDADQKYNAGLFNQLLTDEVIINSSSTFWAIIQDLYFPESTYSFSVFSSDILGNIYEIFLGEQLEIDNKTVVLKKKPENIDRDIVTTPTFIVQDILRQTVLEYCKDKTDTEILSSSFADIACGSGVFLLETYQLLQNILIDYYLAHDKTRLIQSSVNTFKLQYAVKKNLLEKCIFGIDKDYNAVQACQFGLLLKLLENEDNTTISTPALPNLDDNIQFGNSLISSDDIGNNYDLINPFDFDRKFDVIIGNPPYMATEHMKEFTSLELPIYKVKYESAFKQFDKYFLFIERGLQLLSEGGYFGYIVPSKFIKVGAGKKLRNLIINQKVLHQITSFGAKQVFDNKTTYTCLLVLKDEPTDKFKYLEVNSLTDWKTRNISTDIVNEVEINSLDEEGWVLFANTLRPIYQSILSQSQSLEELIGSSNIYNGIQTSANNIYIHKIDKEDGNFIYFTKDDFKWKVEKILTRPYFKTSGGSDNLNTYRPFKANSFVIYPYLKTDLGIDFVKISELITDYPETHKFLKHYQDKLDNKKRDIKPTPETPDEWYRYGRHQSLDKCDVPAKIIVGVLSQGNKYAIDYSGTLISSGGTAGYCIITLPHESAYSIYYIQALLNSKYLEWFSALMGEVFRGGYIARGTKVLKRLPIRKIDFDIQEDKDIHDKITKHQKDLITIQGKIDKCSNKRALTPLERQFSHLKVELDDTLKSLFNLGEADSDIPLISKIYAKN